MTSAQLLLSPPHTQRSHSRAERQSLFSPTARLRLGQRGSAAGGRPFRNVTSEIWGSARRSKRQRERKKGVIKGGREALGEEIYELLFSEPEDT